MKKLFSMMIVLLIPIFVHPISLDQATFQVGQKFFKQRLYKESTPRFLDIVRKYPDSPFYRQSLFYLGQSYAFQGEYKPALQYYKLLLRKARTIKERQSALLGISKSWLQLGVNDKAAQFYSFYAAEYPESEYASAALYFAGIARERENNIEAAVEKYRSVLKEYPDSEFYAKAIEKVAVLESNTPEELWSTVASNNKKTPTNASSIEMFADDDFHIDQVPGIDTSFKAQSFAPEPLKIQETPVAPSVVTQVIIQQNQPVEPIVITQKIEPIMLTQTVVLTQEVTIPSSNNSTSPVIQNTNSDYEELKNSAIVHFSNDQYVPVETQAQKEKRKELEAYRTLWEKEHKEKLREEELKNTQQSIKELVNLTESKAQILSVKEADLFEKQNRLRSSLYQELKKNQVETAPNRYEFLPDVSKTVDVTNTVTVTNTVNVAESVVNPPAPLEPDTEEYYEEAYADDEAYEGEEVYADDEAYEGEEAYADDETYEGEEVYADDEAYEGEEVYADDEAYEGEEAYADDEAYEGEEVYADDEEYYE